MNANSQIRGLSQDEVDELLADLPLQRKEVEPAQVVDDLDKIVASDEDTTPEVNKLGPTGTSGTTGPAGPVKQGTAAVPAVSLDPVEDAKPSEVSDTLAPAATSGDLSTPCLPSGYACFADGIYEMPANESAEPIFICTPLRVDAMFADQECRGWGRLVSVQAADGRWHEVPVASAELQRRPGEVVATLVDHGLELAGDRKSKDRLLDLLKNWRPNERLQTVRHNGWSGNDCRTFILGREVLGDASVLPLVPWSAHVTGLACEGSVEDWKASVGVKCHENPLMILVASLAFSGPLLAPLGLAGGGLHFRGASSSGKTTLLNLAASVWGNQHLISQWRATSNGLEAIAWARNDMLLALDEIAEIPARDLHNAIYMLANGTGKTRMTKDVTLAHQAHWRLALISSGEISVEEKLREARVGAMAGHEVRLIDIEADSRAYGAFDHLHGATNAAAFAEAVQGAVRGNHGAVGRQFVKTLIGLSRGGELAKLPDFANKHAARWLANLPSAPDGQISRVAKRFSLIALAGDLATQTGLTGWGKGEAVNVAEQAFIDWYDRRYGARREAARALVKSMQDFLCANDSALVQVGTSKLGDEPVGWRDGGRVYLTSTTWAKLYPGDAGTRAAKAFLDMQLLLGGEDGRHMRKAPRAIPNRPRVYTLNADAVTAFRAD
ncbi:DUF927 domain-containing protein [Paracoccus liaowanqingii]|uniref:DUF927 domain-containing protein n=1 Tax=Paracoccus liaowanqingii TaxID=2560053 RepID=A0A4Z1CSU4_9RHOB|nr:DUF927 domain-containing protein [Paracoccus liaowanqingii]TGN68562.1 DUF927 domain-containing protein [Paracoccus liaowanqingii]